MFKEYLFVFVFFCGLFGGCSETAIVSKWQNDKFNIDEINPQWKQNLIKMEDRPVFYGISNDESYLYFYFISKDIRINREIVMRGMTVWFDPGGEEERVFGIRYPIGMRELYPTMVPQRNEKDFNREKFNEKFKSSLTELEILGPMENEKFRTSVTGEKGITAEFDQAGSQIVYKLKLPLESTKEHFFAIRTKPGNEISVGIELNKFERDGFGPGGGQPGLRPPDSGFGGEKPEGGFGNPHGRGRRPEFDKRQPVDLEYWVKVKLAEPLN